MSDHGKAHATLSPSSAERWITCPASIRMIDSLERTDDGGSIWAEEGTRAHTRAEIEASYTFNLTTKEQYNTFLASWTKTALEHGDDIEEMERHARTYVMVLQDIAAGIPNAQVFLEQRVQTGVPGSWGTADAVIVGPTRIHAVDYKYGKGVTVRAEANPQLMLYTLGALEMFDGVLGDAETVGMSICQPRVGETSHYSMSAGDLRIWREEVVLPAARETQNPDARFGPSEDACRWCPAAGACAPRAAHITQRDFGNPDLLDPQGLAMAFRSIPEIRSWCSAVEAEALHQAYSEGVSLPGLKVVMSGGKRSITDITAAVEALTGAGYKVEQVTRPSLKTLSDLERLVGKAKLPEVLGPLLKKGDGSPSLVDEDDSRAAINPATEAAKDFQTE